MTRDALIDRLTAEVNRIIQQSPEMRQLWSEARERGIEMNAKLEFTFVKPELDKLYAPTPTDSWLDKLYALSDPRRER